MDVVTSFLPFFAALGLVLFFAFSFFAFFAIEDLLGLSPNREDALIA